MKNFIKKITLPLFGIIISILLMTGVSLPSEQLPNGNNHVKATAFTTTHKPGGSDGEGSGTAADPFYIGSAETLNSLRTDLGKAGTAANPKYFMLVSNIDLSSFSPWTPIASLAANCVFDGNGYVIDNLINNKGLFVTIAGTARNIIFENVILTTGATLGSLAGVASNGAVIENIIVESGEIFGDTTSSASNTAGGVIGYTDGTVYIRNCANKINISAFWFLGGVVGYVNGNSTFTYVSNCYNTGTITGNTNVGGESYNGGVVGLIDRGATIYMDNCYNLGTIIGSNHVGGVLGSSWSAVAVINNCYNSATISALGSIGGITAKWGAHVTLNNCWTDGTKFSGGVVQNLPDAGSNYGKKTTAEMRSGEFAAILGPGFLYNKNINNGYPFLKGLDLEETTMGSVIFDYNDGTNRQQKLSVDLGSSIDKNDISTPNIPGYLFLGWDTKADGTGIRYDGSTDYPVTQDQTTLYAQKRLARYMIVFADTAPTAGLGDVDVQNRYAIMGTTNVISAEGTDFANWQVFVASANINAIETDSNWVTISSEQYTNLRDIVDANFISTYARAYDTPTDGDGLAFIFRAVFKPTTTISFNSSQRSFGYVLVNGSNVGYDKQLRFGNSNPADNFSITIVANAYYEFTHIVVKASHPVAGYNETTYSYSGSGIATSNLTFTYNAALGGYSMNYNLNGATVEVDVYFKETPYTFSLSALDTFSSKLDGTNPDNLIDLTYMFSVSPNTVIGMGQYNGAKTISMQSGLVHTVSADKAYLFVEYRLYNKLYQRWDSFSTSTGTLQISVINKSFFDQYLTADGKIVLTAIFIEQYWFTATTTGALAAKGSIRAFYMDNGFQTVIANPTVGQYVDYNVQVVVQIFPETNYKIASVTGFEGITASSEVRFNMKRERVDIAVTFADASYAVYLETVDGFFKPIAYSGALSSNLSQINFLTSFLEITKNDTLVPGHDFMGWWIRVNSQYISLVSLFDNSVVLTEILENYIDADGRLVIVAQYAQMIDVAIELPEEFQNLFAAGESYEIFVYDESVVGNMRQLAFRTDNTYKLPFGSIVIVKAAASTKYYTFDGYNSKLTGDIEDGLFLETATLEVPRTIILLYTLKMFTVTNSANLTNAKGELVFDESFKLGDTIIITFNTQSGYDLRKFTVSIGGVNLASYLTIKNNVARIEVTKTLLDQLALANNTLIIDTVVETTMNTTFLTVLLVAAVAAPLLLLGILLYAIAVKKKKAEYLKALEIHKAKAAGFSVSDIIKNLTSGKE